MDRCRYIRIYIYTYLHIHSYFWIDVDTDRYRELINTHWGHRTSSTKIGCRRGNSHDFVCLIIQIDF